MTRRRALLLAAVLAVTMPGVLATALLLVLGAPREVVSEYNETTAKHPEYRLQLYIAPKPTDRLSGMNEPAVSTRDRGMERFGPWLEGFLAGRGVIKAGERL